MVNQSRPDTLSVSADASYLYEGIGVPKLQVTLVMSTMPNAVIQIATYFSKTHTAAARGIAGIKKCSHSREHEQRPIVQRQMTRPASLDTKYHPYTFRILVYMWMADRWNAGGEPSSYGGPAVPFLPPVFSRPQTPGPEFTHRPPEFHGVDPRQRGIAEKQQLLQPIRQQMQPPPWYSSYRPNFSPPFFPQTQGGPPQQRFPPPPHHPGLPFSSTVNCLLPAPLTSNLSPRGPTLSRQQLFFPHSGPILPKFSGPPTDVIPPPPQLQIPPVVPPSAEDEDPFLAEWTKKVAAAKKDRCPEHKTLKVSKNWRAHLLKIISYCSFWTTWQLVYDEWSTVIYPSERVYYSLRSIGYILYLCLGVSVGYVRFSHLSYCVLHLSYSTGFLCHMSECQEYVIPFHWVISYPLAVPTMPNILAVSSLLP